MKQAANIGSNHQLKQGTYPQEIQQRSSWSLWSL